MFVALNFVTTLNFSGQDFIFETVMRSCSRLDFLELNPYASDNKVDCSSHMITKKRSRVLQNKIMTQYIEALELL